MEVNAATASMQWQIAVSKASTDSQATIAATLIQGALQAIPEPPAAEPGKGQNIDTLA